MSKALDGHDPLKRKRAPKFSNFCLEFLDWIDSARLDDDTRRYYRNGIRLLRQTTLTGWKLDQITSESVEALHFPGSAANANNALRTLRRMYSKAKDWKLIGEKPKFRLFKEWGRSLNLDEQAEQRLLPVADQPLKDIIVAMRDTGLRNVKELYAMRIENIDWKRCVFCVPESKTPEGRRWVPISDRFLEILKRRCGDRREGWVWQSRKKGKHIGAAMVNRMWNQAREKAGLSKDLVLYCARHDFGTSVMGQTGNLKLVMDVMGHSDVGTAVRYQHPGTEMVRTAINERNSSARFAAQVQNGQTGNQVSD
jgi:integrase